MNGKDESEIDTYKECVRPKSGLSRNVQGHSMEVR